MSLMTTVEKTEAAVVQDVAPSTIEIPPRGPSEPGSTSPQQSQKQRWLLVRLLGALLLMMPSMYFIGYSYFKSYMHTLGFREATIDGNSGEVYYQALWAFVHLFEKLYMMLLEPQVSWGYFLALGVSVALIMLLVIILANWLSGKYQPIKDSISSRLPIESPARGKLLAAGISLMAGVSAMATPLLLVVAISILSVGLLLFTASPMLGVSKANEHLKTGLCHDFEWTKRESREVVTGCNVIKVKGEDAIEKAYIVYRNSKFFYIHTKEKAITLPISSVDSIEVALQRNPNANANLEQEKEG